MANDPTAPILPALAIICRGVDRPGVLHDLTGVILRHHGNIASVDIVERGDGLYHHITIRPAVDFSKLEDVLVVLAAPAAAAGTSRRRRTTTPRTGPCQR